MSIPKLDAWVLRRLLVGHTVNGELLAVSAPWRDLAEHLAALPLGSRQGAFDGFLAGRPDRDEIIVALSEIDPEGQAPEAMEDDGETFDDWEPIRLGELPAVEPFPTEVLPGTVADFVRTVAKAIGCPEDFVALPVLVTAGASIGRSASLHLKPGYFASAALYGVPVGLPSSGKSPAQKAVTDPVWREDERLHEVYKAERDAYDVAMEARPKAPRGSFKPKQPQSANSEEPEAPGDPRPIKPVLASVAVENATVEALAPLLSVNPRGLLVARDELSAWVASMNQYKAGGKGDDRQFWLSALFGRPIRVDRRGSPDEPIRVPHPFLSVIGGIQPDLLPALRESNGRADGFVERILFAYPDPLPRPRWSDEGIPDEASAGWAEIVRRLLSRPLAVSEGRSHPQVVTFTPEAKSRWVEWYDAQADETNGPGYDASELAADGKLCDFAARLALILHLLSLEGDPTRDEMDPIPPAPRSVVDGAIKLWAYFRSHGRRVRWSMNGGIGNPDARSILGWIKRSGIEAFSERDLRHHLPRFRDDPEAMSAALGWLAERNVIRAAPEPDRPEGKRGRKPSQIWMVNPALHRTDTPRD